MVTWLVLIRVPWSVQCCQLKNYYFSVDFTIFSNFLFLFISNLICRDIVTFNLWARICRPTFHLSTVIINFVFSYGRHIGFLHDQLRHFILNSVMHDTPTYNLLYKLQIIFALAGFESHWQNGGGWARALLSCPVWPLEDVKFDYLFTDMYAPQRDAFFIKYDIISYILKKNRFFDVFIGGTL